MRRGIHTEEGLMKDLVPRGIVLATAVLLVLTVPAATRSA